MNDKSKRNALPRKYVEILIAEYRNLLSLLSKKYDSFNVPEIDNDPKLLRIHAIWKEIEEHTYQLA